jgi:iron-sulfur cluster repair protein YtfE (RIC family)
MEPAEVRERIRTDHERLREALDALAWLAERFEAGDRDAGPELRDAALALYEHFAAHLSLEETLLEPALRGQGSEGCRLADRLAHEHHEQRELLGYLVGRLRSNLTPTRLVAREVRHFVEYVRLDMAHEESTLLTPAVLPGMPARA